MWDDRLKGFGVMVTSTGVRSYVVQYRLGGRNNRIGRVTIGRHGSPWTAERARDRAAELLELVRRKVDPFVAERERLAAERARDTAAKAESQAASHLAFSVFADRFMEKYAKIKQPKTWRDTESVIRRDLKPHLLDRPLPSIFPVDVVALLDKVQDRGDGAAIKAY
ncbi:MAG: integrase arm-type DNA-binding domain-containing protein, partial [Pseudomonadota bacterium]|nr:integrase arm-type DNA-binding domain-containing protein [Pseudomonadota bacterium]